MYKNEVLSILYLTLFLQYRGGDQLMAGFAAVDKFD